MSFSDPLADMLTTIRNGQQAGLASVRTPASKLRIGVLEVLKSEGYIREFAEEEHDGRKKIKIELKYFEGQPAIKVINKISTPGRRRYSKIGKLPKFYNGLGVSVLSTSKGVMTDRDAKVANVGGEVLCSIF
jgi:small subunit ribosomal protein S8